MKIAPNAQMKKGLPFLEALFSYRLARLAGFEPTTPWFVAKYSIQLSYSRTRGPNCIAIRIARKYFVKIISRRPDTPSSDTASTLPPPSLTSGTWHPVSRPRCVLRAP